MEKKWEIYVIHHSHTDIGYTERQEKIARYHYDFIRQAIDILNKCHENSEAKYEGFVWQCENHWQIENFYEMADDSYKKKLEHYISTGEIGLSGNYLNMTELVSEDVFGNALDRVQQYGESIGHKITSGMSADVNGMPWGCADLFHEHGIKNFFTCIHTHHGMFPLNKKVMPFYWESPKGNKILVWNGDHYHLGNDMFLAPHAGGTYMVKDEFSQQIIDDSLVTVSREATEKAELEIAITRVERYLENLESEEYPYSIVPLMVSGVSSDNSPPSLAVLSRIKALNEHFGDKINIKMANLEQFFKAVEEKCENIPTYKGDWTDWWADGVGSTPAETKLYREAVRKTDICKKLDNDGELGDKKLLVKAEKEQILYAEHTWGYSSSVSEPWETLVSSLERKKGAYAVNANTYISKNLDKILSEFGELSIKQDKPQTYSVINPHNRALNTKAYLYIEFWEYIGGIHYNTSIPIEVVDCDTGEIIPSQVKRIARAVQVEIEINMKAHEKRKLKIQLAKRKYGTTKNHVYIGADGVKDFLNENGYRVDEDQIETDYMIMKMNDEKGIYSIYSKKDSKELIRENTKEGAFAGIYEYTEMPEGACEVRRAMGRNRKSKATKRYVAQPKNRKITENGDVFVSVELDYELEGTRMYTIFAKIYKHQPKLEAMIRLHKESRWEPENLYVSLPFTAGESTETYIDKTGCILRPGIDQLIGSCQDFYLIQNGTVWKDGATSVVLVTKDTPLVTFGKLESKPIKLCSAEDTEHNQSEVYSWVMNNFWETNFKVDLGGFYEFSYTLLLEENKSPEELFEICTAENEGLVAYYTE